MILISLKSNRIKLERKIFNRYHLICMDQYFNHVFRPCKRSPWSWLMQLATKSRYLWEGDQSDAHNDDHYYGHGTYSVHHYVHQGKISEP